MDASDHIAIVDDDPAIRELLAEQLKRQGLRVSAAASAKALRTLLMQSPVDLIVLDVMMPGEDGLTLLKSLRASEHAATPVLLLTALAEDVDRIIGLEMGADDYLSKPFAPRELVARIRAVLRRARMLPPGQASARPSRYARFGDWQLDSVERLLTSHDGVSMPLNGAEFSLLLFLLDHAQHIVTRDQLLVHLAGRDADVFDRSVDLRVSRLRKRLGDDAREPSYIKTVRNEGYVLAKPVQWQDHP
ncbi:response regulator [Ottowia sp.]|uniref:response regulator n=1 Tax=Ottowia sp. TaxID=1898956 RepID=UPI003A8968B1